MSEFDLVFYDPNKTFIHRSNSGIRRMLNGPDELYCICQHDIPRDVCLKLYGHECTNRKRTRGDPDNTSSKKICIHE